MPSKIIKPKPKCGPGPDKEIGEKTKQDATQQDTLVLEKSVMTSKQLRQRDFLQAYANNGYNVAAACRTIGLNRKQYYRWLKSDPAFAENLEIAQHELKDYLKSKLLQLVDQGNLIATIFACKSLGGMIEGTKQDITITKGPEYDQDQLDALVRGQIPDRQKYEDILKLHTPSDQ